jgi:hypothetical protein
LLPLRLLLLLLLLVVFHQSPSTRVTSKREQRNRPKRCDGDLGNRSPITVGHFAFFGHRLQQFKDPADSASGREDVAIIVRAEVRFSWRFSLFANEFWA